MMKPIEIIRKQVLAVTQVEFARIAGVSQGTVSRWEKGDLEPSLEEMGRIRGAALKAGTPWDDRWFFEAPRAA